MTRNQILVGIAVLAIIAAFTNPNQDRHKEVLKSKLNSYFQESMRESITETDNEWEQAGQALGMMLGGALIDQILNNLVSTDNYVLFSVTKISFEGDSKTIGFGAFGNVFLTSELDNALEEGLMSEGG